VAPVVTLPAPDGKTVMLLQVFPSTSPQDVGTTNLISNLRTNVIPQSTVGSGEKILVGGITAVFVDFSDTLSSKLPLFIGIVVLFSFLLLAVVFRSIVVPLTAAVMNLLSIGASFGVMTAIFQHGWLGGVFGVSRAGPIEAFVPVMMFAIIFGLSMDYEVFLVTRIHEEWLRSGENTTAVRNGLAATGKTITAAALIMILVFGSFIFGGNLIIKEFGVGLATGVIVDALLIRMAVVPSVMQLLGRANWWYPRWLERVTPKISVDPEHEGFDLGEGAESELVR
jgi:RND superfamily putative drug exporter